MMLRLNYERLGIMYSFYVVVFVFLQLKNVFIVFLFFGECDGRNRVELKMKCQGIDMLFYRIFSYWDLVYARVDPSQFLFSSDNPALVDSTIWQKSRRKKRS